MQGHFGQEGNDNTLWDTAEDPTKTKAKLPILAMVPYEMVQWPFQANSMPNELRLWIENQDKDDPNFQKDEWELFKNFMMAAVQVYALDKNSSMLKLVMETETATDEGFWNWVEN